MLVRIFFMFMCILISGTVLPGCTKSRSEVQTAQFKNMGAELPPDAIIKRDKNETIRLLKGANLSKLLEENKDFEKLRSEKKHTEIALAFLSEYSSVFKLVRPSDELVAKSVRTDEIGMTHLRFQQVFKNIPVWTGEITVHLTGSDSVYQVDGQYIPTPVGLDINPALSRNDAFLKVAENLEKVPECPKCQSELVIFAAPSGNLRLAYRVLTVSGMMDGWIFIIDAKTGDILKKISTIHTPGLDFSSK